MAKPNEAPFDGLIASFERSLRAKNRSPRTIHAYVTTAEAFAEFCAQEGFPGQAVVPRRGASALSHPPAPMTVVSGSPLLCRAMDKQNRRKKDVHAKDMTIDPAPPQWVIDREATKPWIENRQVFDLTRGSFTGVGYDDSDTW